MEQKFVLNISEQQLVDDLLTTTVETLWDVYSGPEEMEREEVMDQFIGSCRLLLRFETELGWRLPETKIFRQAMNYFRDRYMVIRTIEQMEQEYIRYCKDLESDGHAGTPSGFITTLSEWETEDGSGFRLQSVDLAIDFLKRHKVENEIIGQVCVWLTTY